MGVNSPCFARGKCISRGDRDLSCVFCSSKQFFSGTQAHEHQLNYDGFRDVVLAMASKMWPAAKSPSSAALMMQHYLVRPHAHRRWVCCTCRAAADADVRAFPGPVGGVCGSRDSA